MQCRGQPVDFGKKENEHLLGVYELAVDLQEPELAAQVRKLLISKGVPIVEKKKPEIVRSLETDSIFPLKEWTCDPNLKTIADLSVRNKILTMRKSKETLFPVGPDESIYKSFIGE